MYIPFILDIAFSSTHKDDGSDSYYYQCLDSNFTSSCHHPLLYAVQVDA